MSRWIENPRLSSFKRKRRIAMDEVANLSMLEELMHRPERISPVEKLLNEFETHEGKEGNPSSSTRRY
jgi:hypothetical protein